VLTGQRGMGGGQCLLGACGYWGALREGGSAKNGRKETMRLVVAGVKGSWQAGGGRLGKNRRSNQRQGDRAVGSTGSVEGMSRAL